MRVGLFIAFSLVLTVTGCGKKQQVIFEAQSISYMRKDSSWTPEIEKECKKISTALSTLMEVGWKVVASSPKEKLVYDNRGTCVGTEYILEK